jgi:hypothetical protein
VFRKSGYRFCDRNARNTENHPNGPARQPAATWVSLGRSQSGFSSTGGVARRGGRVSWAWITNLAATSAFGGKAKTSVAVGISGFDPEWTSGAEMPLPHGLVRKVFLISVRSDGIGGTGLLLTWVAGFDIHTGLLRVADGLRRTHTTELLQARSYEHPGCNPW